MYFRAVEIPTLPDAELYVISHQNIYYRRFASDPGVQCSAFAVSSTAGLKVSSTVLRRMDQVTVDRSIDILAAFYNSPNDVFYLGYEVGPRVCGNHTAPDALISLWTVPSGTIRGTHNGRVITFQKGVKYLYYFDTEEPCLYEGNAAEKGDAQRVDKAASAITNPGAISPGSALIGPDGKSVGKVTNEGTIITSAGAVSTAKAPAVLASPDPPTEDKPVTTSAGEKTGTVGTFDARNNPECLPGSAVLRRREGGEVEVRDLKVGDVVATGRGEYGKVFAFSHRDAWAVGEIVRLETARRKVRLTRGHLVPSRIDGGGGICKGRERLVAAAAVTTGKDCLYDAEEERWVGVEAVVREGEADVGREGLYNPHTLTGTIVVDGLLLSCYTTALRPEKAAPLLRAVHALRAGRVVPWVSDLFRFFDVVTRSVTRPLHAIAFRAVSKCPSFL